MSNKTPNVFKMTKSEFTNYQIKLTNWRFKVDFLKVEIDKMKKEGTKYPIIQIAAFLLKTQVIEYEIKQLFVSLDLDIAIKLRIVDSALTREIRTPEDFDEKTLGQTLNCFYEYKGLVTEKLKVDLKKLNKLRRLFAHHMFDDDKDIRELMNDAKNGAKLVDKITSQLNELKDKIIESRKLNKVSK